MTPTSSRDLDGVAQDDGWIGGLNWVRLREAALYGKDAWGQERELVAKLVRDFPELGLLFGRLEAGRARAVRLLAADRQLRQWIHCGPGYPATTAEGDTYRIVLPHNPHRKVLYLTDNPVIAAHSRALRTTSQAGQVRVITTDPADPWRPFQVRQHPDIDGWLDWDQPIVVVFGDTWMHYPGPTEQAVEVIDEWVDQLVDGSYTVSAHLQLPDSEEGVHRAELLASMLASTPIGPLRFRTPAEIESLYPKQQMYDVERGPIQEPDRGTPAPTLLDGWVVDRVGQVTGSRSAGPAPSAYTARTVEVMRYTGYTKMQLRRLAKTGRIPAVKGPMGEYLFDLDEVLQIIETWKDIEFKGRKPPGCLPLHYPDVPVDGTW
ncbi:SAM-dependent methyltransferase [Kribbella sp. NPDC059898]|uniref:SAM-dependent methyltransferase n=1 Tax=Kribbella sp. NPDC059898 TaxID=3346995 RepID=UPI00364B412D